MVTFDSNQVRTYAERIHAKLDQCAHGEGAICAGIDERLTYFADRCWEFYLEVRHWAREIFAGRMAYDRTAEKFWIAELERLARRAEREWVSGGKAETECFVLDGRAKLAAALWNLRELMNPWVTPHLSTGPAARRADSLATSTEEFRERIHSLVPLPGDWMPREKQQAARFRAAHER